jgi:hypothetical protein
MKTTTEEGPPMNAIYYDTEFLEDGKTTDLISIGMVTDDGREYYAVVGDDDLISRAREHPWLLESVVSSLPVKASGTGNFWDWDGQHPDYPSVKDRAVIAAEVRDFILAKPDPRLWAWYGSYDHVVLSQLWGRMIDHPAGVPMWTADLKQETELLGYGEDDLPALPGVVQHNALSDAREVKFRAEWLAQHWQDNAKRWPSVRLVRDVDDFQVHINADGDLGMRCPGGEPDGECVFWEDSLTLGSLLEAAYEHIDHHKAEGR